jgi:pimeloyl-ACP methyl ester carboxylesterase
MTVASPMTTATANGKASSPVGDAPRRGTPGEIHFIDNGSGWRLALKRVPPERGTTAARPVLLVPGYGMNSFIFGFHPRGLSLEAYLASRGLEVWSVDLRDQGRSVREHGTDRYGLAELALEDLGCAIAHVIRTTRTGHRELDLVGCSLGAALSFTHLATVREAPVHTVVSMGGLVTWVKIHTILRAAFFSPWLAGRVRVRDTRKLAGRALPALARWAPWLLSVYLNAESTDVSHAQTMIQTVEDPNPYINREIAEWVRRRELVVRGVNVSRALPTLRHPFLGIVANHDGVVPPDTSRAIFHAIGSPDKSLLEVGNVHTRIAHADLFLSTGAQPRIFAPLADFLLARG